MSKLEWALGSLRQLEDAASIVRVRSGALDDQNVDRSAAELGVVDLLGEVRRSAR